MKESLHTLHLDARGPLSQQVYRLLFKMIGELRVLPNQFLSEKDVAEGMGISRTPVREAFIRLAEEGLVQIIPKSGTYVSRIDTSRINEGLFIWRGLESACASRIAETATFVEIAQLRDYVALQRHCLNARDEKGFRTANEKFHKATFTLSGFIEALEMMQNAKFEVRRLLGLYKKHEFDMTDVVVNEQWNIVNKMAEHEKKATRNFMANHLMRVKQEVDAILAEESDSQFLQQINRKKSGKRQTRQ